MKKINKLIIIGSGPSGYTSAIYSSRLNLKPILITGNNEGGQIIKSNNIENWPGEYKKISGFDLIKKMKKQAIKFKTKIINDKINKIKIKKNKFILFSKKNKYISKSIIIATGCKPRKLKLKIKKKIYNKIISNCANCDGYFYKNKTIAIIGGGNNAIEEILIMYKIAKKVIIIHRRKYFTSDKILYKKIKNKIKKKKIIFFKNYILYNIKKKKYINLTIKSKTNNKIKKIKVDGLFVSIGYKPNTKIFKKYIKLNKKNYIITNYKYNKYKSMTNIKGIFAAGDVTNSKYKQAIIASSSGCIAAIEVQKYLENI